MKMKKAAGILVVDVLASLLLGVSIVVFTVSANFAPGGVSGVAVILNYLFGTPIGLATVIINVPIVVLTFRQLGPVFFAMSVKSVLINAFFIDYVCCLFPVYAGNRLMGAVLAGVTAGMAYSLLFNVGSSTGGTDFIIAAVNKAHPNLSFGTLAFLIDGLVIASSVFVYGEMASLLYGMVYTVVTSLSLDATTWCIKKTGVHAM